MLPGLGGRSDVTTSPLVTASVTVMCVPVLGSLIAPVTGSISSCSMNEKYSINNYLQVIKI